MRIGYQGEIGSNSEEAAKVFAMKHGMSVDEFIPLVDSKTVIYELKNKRIDLAVVATRNSTAGTVKETFNAIKDEYFELVGTEILPIHHCLFKRKGIETTNITTIASHIQALKQTASTRETFYPGLKEVEVEDTAKAAQMLREGSLPKEYAVLCRKNAGEENDLELIQENMEDNKDNKTEFRILKLPEIDYSNNERPTFMEWLRYQFASENGANYFAKIIMAIGIIVAILVSQRFGRSTLDVALTVGGYTAIVILFFTSNSFRSKTKYRLLNGYWKYYSLSNMHEEDNEQRFSTPRIVRIFEEDEHLKLKGVICDNENVPFFESKEHVFVSSISKQRGGMIYYYGVPNEGIRRSPVGGIAHLEWSNKHPAAKVNKMSGEYHGSLSGDSGTLTYLRITKKEYDVHRNSRFL